jgi:hypothetical protein
MAYRTCNVFDYKAGTGIANGKRRTAIGAIVLLGLTFVAFNAASVGTE